MNDFVVLGMGGHARVVAELLESLQKTVRGFVAPLASPTGGRYLGTDDEVLSSLSRDVPLANGLGFARGAASRQDVIRRYLDAGYEFPMEIHPTAWVSPSANIAEGTLIFAGAVVQAGSRIGEQVVVNTRASIDHDCQVAAWTHIGPGAILCGGVEIGAGAQIGAGATIIPGVKIGERAVIGAGAAVIRNVEPGQTVAGVPAKAL